MANPDDRHFSTAHAVIMREFATSPPAPIVDSFMMDGEGISAFTRQRAPRSKWIVWFVFPDEGALRLAQREKCSLISRRMKESLKESGYLPELAENLDIRFCSKDAIDRAGTVPQFLEQQLVPGPRAEPGVSSIALKAVWLSPSSLLVYGGLLVLVFGGLAGLPEWLRWIAVVLLVPSAIVHYRQHKERKRDLLGGLFEAAGRLGFIELHDARASLAARGLDRARAFRGHRIRWGLERPALTPKTVILAGAAAGSVGDDVEHHLVACWPLAGLPLPDFDLRPETLAGRVVIAVGGQDIDFETNPAFSAQYRLRGDDEGAVRRVFRPEVTDFLIRRGSREPWLEGWHVEAREGWVVVYRRHSIASLALELLPGFLESSQELFELLTGRR